MTNIAAIVAQMTVEEKAALCTGATTWTTTPVERLGVPELLMTDGPHGVRKTTDVTSVSAASVPATCFPTASALACTWDPDLIRQMGAALGEECNALGVGVLLGPGVNMKRTPLCGRNFEYFSEDPFLAGVMSAAHIQGLQSKGVGASLKHYAANNQESERFSINAEIDERTLRENYLPAFEMAVKQGQPWTVMCSYNRINGVFGSEHRSLLTDVLRGEWGFEGFVVSDWGAVHDRVKALAAGLDLEMPGPRARRTQEVIDAVRCGSLDQAVLDEAARRILAIVFKAAQTAKADTFDAGAHHTLARRIAGESMVLLKNDGLLPLKNVRRIAAIGRAAQEPHFQGGGSSHINPTRVDLPLDELRVASGDAEISYSAGYPAGPEMDQSLIDEAVAAARAADVALLFIALPSFKESEGYDRADLDLTPQQVVLIQAVGAAQPRTAVILNNGSAVTMSAWIDSAAAVLEAWMMGQAGAGAIADILFGRVNPCGKLAETFPLKLADTPAFINFPGDLGTVRYGEGLYIGYRYYDAKEIPALFPFGYGLSYTTFAYSNLHVSAHEFRDVDGVTVSLDVTNTGDVAGKEIVQLYVHDKQASLHRPYKELKGFAKVELQPGETKTVTIPLDFRSFAFYHPTHGQWITEDGEFDLLAGASAADIRLSTTVALRSTLDLPSILHMESTVRSWMEDRRGRSVFEPFLAELSRQMGAMFGTGEADSTGIGMDMMGFLMDMPLLSLLHFQGDASPVPPEQIVGQLLAQVHGASNGEGEQPSAE